MTDEEISRLAAIRGRFSGAAACTYLNVAARGLLSVDCRNALEQHLDQLRDGMVDKEKCFETVERVREKYAELINAKPEEIAYTRNVSDGLNIIAASLDWNCGESVILCLDLEHPANIYPWRNLNDRAGVEIINVASRDGAIDVEAIVDRIDIRTRLVAVSSVTSAPGLRTDIAFLGRACRARGVLLMTDGAQSVGVISSDVQAQCIDGMAVATQKALLGLYGLGFLYCRKEIAEQIRPAALARFGVNLDNGHEGSVGGADYEFMRGALRFDIGNYNYPAIFAVEPALDMLLDIAVPAIERHACGLACRLGAGLRELGLNVVGGSPGPTVSHIVSVGRFSPNQDDCSPDADIEDLFQYLSRHRVKLSMRAGMLRFSFHLYNNEADVSRVLEVVEKWQSERAS